MTINSQITAVCEVLGWTNIRNLIGVDPSDGLQDSLPSLNNDLNELADARNKLINSTELRVKWINNLRTIVSRKCEKNKVGNALVSDCDLLFADSFELLEALVKTIGKWEK